VADREFAPPINTTNKVGADERSLLDDLHALISEYETAKTNALERNDGFTDEDDLKLYRGEVGPKDRLFECNFTQAFIDRLVAQLTDNRPILRVEHRKRGLANVARALEKGVIAVWQETDLQRQVFKMCHNAAIKRSAGLYTGYDPATDDIYVEMLRPDQLLADPAVLEAGLLDHAEALFIKRVVPLSLLRRRFPGRGALVTPDKASSPGRSAMRTVESPVTTLLEKSRESKASQSVNAVIPRATVWEGCIRDRQVNSSGKLVFPYGRNIHFTRDVVLWDGAYPYWDAQWPVDWYDWTVDPDHLWGHSAISLLRRIQTAFNQLVDGTVENQIITNFVSIIGDHDVLTNRQWTQLQKIRNSLVLKKQGGPNKTLTLQPPPPFGADRMQLSKFLFTFAQMITGVTDVTLGETAGSLQSGLAIEGLQEGANLMTRARASRLEDLLSRVGQKLVARILQFVTADRVFSIMGPSGEAVEYALARSELFINDDKSPVTPDQRREFFKYLRFTVAPGSSAPGTRARRAEMMMRLNAIGAASRKMVLQAADFPDPDYMLKEAEEDFQKFPPAGFKRDPNAVNAIAQRS